jgi:hypothetical protein
MSSVYTYDSGTVTYQTIGSSAAGGVGLPVVIASTAALTAKNLEARNGYLSLAEYNALEANASSDLASSFSLELVVNFNAYFDNATYPEINTHDLEMEVRMGKFGITIIPLYCNNVLAGLSYFSANAILMFDKYYSAYNPTTDVVIYDKTNASFPVFRGSISFRINYRSQ